MKANEERLYRIAYKFRQAIEQTDLSEEVVGREGYLRMRNFPDGACAEACNLLGLYLMEEQNIGSIVHRSGQIEAGDQWYGSHHWLEHDSIIIDIAADQFSIIDEPVIVSSESDFHRKYAQDRSKITASFALESETDWIIKLYRAVRSTLINLDSKVE